MSGLCEVCIRPGACCTRLSISGGRQIDRHRIGEAQSRERAESLAIEQGLWMMTPAHQEADGTWRYSCTALDGRTGRCTIYEDRPGLCRSFAPGSDPLCVHYWGADAG